MSAPDLGLPRPEGMDVPVPVTISRTAFTAIVPWFLDKGNEERRAYTNGPASDGFLTDQQFDQRLSAKLAKRLFEVAASGNLNAEVVTFDLSYGELDLVILSSISSHPEFPDVDRSRRLVAEGSLPLSMVYCLKELKGPILELLESFIAKGGQDSYGYLEGMRKIVAMDVLYADGDEFYGDEGFFYLEDGFGGEAVG